MVFGQMASSDRAMTGRPETDQTIGHEIGFCIPTFRTNPLTARRRIEARADRTPDRIGKGIRSVGDSH